MRRPAAAPAADPSAVVEGFAAGAAAAAACCCCWVLGRSAAVAGASWDGETEGVVTPDPAAAAMPARPKRAARDA